MTNAGVTAIGTGKVVAGMLATDAVETAKIKDANVTTAKLADAAVTTAKITDANVTTAKLADAAVTTAKITDANVTTAKLADAAVTTAKITDANVTTDKLAANAVTTAKITDANVTTAKLADTAVTTAKITDAAITYAKIQNVSATDKILGRISTGAGVIEEIATTGSGNVVRATSPTLVTPVLGAATGTSLSVSGQLTSTVATGTAPLVVTSTTPVANLSIGGTAATATNIAGGAAGSIPYQTAAATTAMLAKGTDGQVLTLASGVPSWSTSNAVPYTGATGAVDLGAYDLKVNGLTVGRGNTGDGTNTAVGASALLTNTAGTDNTAVGYNALKTTTGSLNSAFGSLALKTNTSGTRNAAFGTMAIQANSTGTNNSGFGYGTLYATTASDNTGIGYLAGYNVTSGAKNIFIGSLAGNSISTASLANTTGLNSVLIGYDVRPLANADTNEIVLSGYNGTAGTVGLGSNTTLIGNSTTTNARIMGALNLPNATTSTSTTTGALTVGGGVGIVENLNVGGNVKITGTIEIDGGTPGAGKVLTSDANGVASWTTLSGGVTTMAAIGSVPNANGASISGTTLTLQPADATNGGVVNTTNQTFAGSKTFNSDISVNTVKIGKGNGTGSGNTALGSAALNANTTGSYNTMVGGNSGVSNTTGQGNVSVGYSSLNSNTTGSNNISIGNAAMNGMNTYNYNVGIGQQALRYVKGNYNVAIGDGAGANLGSAATTGTDNNIMIGGNAGYQAGVNGSNTAGKYSIFIGHDTRPAADAETNEIVISGYDGNAGTIGLGSNSTLIGNSATTQAKIFGALTLPSTTASTSTTTGALKVGGGVGIVGNTYIGGTLSIAGGTPGAGKVLTSDANGLASWTYGSSAVLKPTATATISISDKYVFYDGAADGTLTLPAATGNAGKEIIIKNRTTKVVTVSRTASETIYVDTANSAVTTFTIGSEASNNWVKLVSDGNNWVVFRGLF